MNSHENVIRAINFTGPERIPMIFPDYPDYPGYGDPDILGLSYTASEGRKFSEGEDEWRCLWGKIDGKTMGRVVKPPLSNWVDFDNYEFPNPLAKDRFKEAKEKFLKIKDKYSLGGSGFTLFERMHFLRGFKNLLEDLYLNRQKVEVLAKRVLDFQIQIVKAWGGLGANGVSFSDDWGTQNGLIIHPKMWREFFKPRYKELFDAVHKEGMHAFFHSDGQIYEIIPDLIECGVDVLEVTQPDLLGIEKLGKDFGGKICFYGAVDKQNTLLRGSKDAIRREARRLINALGAFNGGFIAMGDMADFHDLEIPWGNFKVMCEAFKEFGKY